MTARPSRQHLKFEDHVDLARVDALIDAARVEDLGVPRRDLSSELFIGVHRQATAIMRARQPGVWCGGGMLRRIAGAYDPAIVVEEIKPDGAMASPQQVLARYRGPLGSILTMERVALNFVTHLSGIATLTRRFVDAVSDTRAAITDTRKTIPGLREPAKFAVVCGGGKSHRMGLYDAVLIKDNHLAGVPLDQLTAVVRAMTTRAREVVPVPDFVEVEVDTLDQLERVLPCGVDMVLLDNMSVEALRRAVAMRDDRAPRVLLEASGGVTLTTVELIARTGVDRIAVGAITHSAPALDIGLDIDDALA